MSAARGTLDDETAAGRATAAERPARIPALAIGPRGGPPSETAPVDGSPVESASADVASPESDAEGCLSCGAALRGEFCHGCGARRARPDDLALGRILRMVAQEATDLDSRAVTTLRLLVFRPGFLTGEFVRGVRGAFVGPVRLFVWAYAAAVVVYSIPWLQPYVTPSGGGPLGAEQEAAVRAVMAAQGIPRKVAMDLLEGQAQSYATWFSGMIVLGFALAVLLVNLRSRRPFGVHAVFSLHFGAFNYLMGIVIVPVLLLASLRPEVGGPVVTLGIMALTCTYMYLAVRRVYGGGRVTAAAKTLVLLVAFSLSQYAVSLLAYEAARATLA